LFRKRLDIDLGLDVSVHELTVDFELVLVVLLSKRVEEGSDILFSEFFFLGIIFGLGDDWFSKCPDY